MTLIIMHYDEDNELQIRSALHWGETIESVYSDNVQSSASTNDQITKSE